MWDNLYWQRDKMSRMFVFALIFLSSNLVFEKSFGEGKLEYENARINVCEECKFLNGRGYLRFFGFKIYEATLFSEYKSGEIFNSKFYLRIKYFRDLKGEDIAKISFKEMHRLNLIVKEKESVWLEWMEEYFPDIKKNDVLTGVYKPEEGLTLHHNETVVTHSNDKDFARSFFLIWLHENSSEPTLRQELLQFREDG